MEQRLHQILDTLREQVEAFVRESITMTDAELPAALLQGRTALSLAIPDQPALRDALFVQMARQEGTMRAVASALAQLEEQTGRPLSLAATPLDGD